MYSRDSLLVIGGWGSGDQDNPDWEKRSHWNQVENPHFPDHMVPRLQPWPPPPAPASCCATSDTCLPSTRRHSRAPRCSRSSHYLLSQQVSFLCSLSHSCDSVLDQCGLFDHHCIPRVYHSIWHRNSEIFTGWMNGLAIALNSLGAGFCLNPSIWMKSSMWRWVYWGAVVRAKNRRPDRSGRRNPCIPRYCH